MLLLYPEFPASKPADAVLLLNMIVIAVTAFFLLVEYINTHQTHHLVWAMAFIGAYVVWHQVALTSELGVVSGVGAGLSMFTSGAIVAGLLFSVFGKEKKLLGRFSFGMLYLIFAIVTGVITTLLTLAFTNLYWFTTSEAWIRMTIIMIFYLVNAIVIVGLPIYTTYKTKETSKSALLISVGGVLWTLVGIFWALAYASVEVEIMVNMIVYFVVASWLFYVFGLFLEKKWRFNIPGVEFEERD
jgi:hypothetical protein